MEKMKKKIQGDDPNEFEKKTRLRFNSPAITLSEHFYFLVYPLEHKWGYLTEFIVSYKKRHENTEAKKKQ